jgi:UTP--glucose-1-phosphate uridylyltransferase
MNTINLPDELVRKMKENGIDVGISKRILENYNLGKYSHFVPVQVKDIPEIDGSTIIDVTAEVSGLYDFTEAQQKIKGLGVDIDLSSIGKIEGNKIMFDSGALRKLGILLYPLLSYGVLNGGSASSYVDYKKNKSFNEALFDICRDEFESIESVSRGKAKGITPALINEDGSHGPSFLELKMRALLIEVLRFQSVTGTMKSALWPMFQMTSVYNNDQIAETYKNYRETPYLKDLIEATGLDITNVETGIQPMLAAFTHSSQGKKKDFFTRAYNEENSPLPMPGGHGQNFLVLKDVYRKLHEQGKRFIYLGNVDNLGFTINPECLALLALSGKEAGFDFAFRTKVDVKGGVLITDQNGRLNCADIGPAISKQEIIEIEKQGKKVLFNCATGLFSLDYLVSKADFIIDNLPMRFTDQDKDAGRYSQAEQVTWEVIGIMDDFLIFGVDKYDRFLASKLLLEGLMTSGIGLDNPSFPSNPDPEKDLKGIADKLHKGLVNKLKNTYGMKKNGNRWVPMTAAEVRELF